MAEPPINFNGLDSTVHGPLRLGILTALLMEGMLDFSSLKKRFEVADGQLGAHLRKLEDSGYISVKKSFVRRRPRTTYRITRQGQAALMHYLDEMQRLIDAVDDASDHDAGRPGGKEQ